MAHLVVKFILAAMFRNILECCNKESRVILGWKDNVKRIAPTGICFIIFLSYKSDSTFIMVDLLFVSSAKHSGT